MENNKSILREKYLIIRKNAKNKIELDEKILGNIINLKDYKEANTILIYVSLNEEVNTIKLIKYSLKIGKKIAVPKCEGNNISFYYINSLNDLKEGTFKILEPKTDKKLTNFDKSICIIPGVAFDKMNNRIGYGKGFYDRFLKTYTGKKIGVTYKICICEKIDTNKDDIKMDLIIHD